MQAVLLDTDIFSFFFKQDTRATLYSGDIQGRELCLCFQTVAELRCWAVQRNWGDKRRQQLVKSLRNYLILPYDDAMAQCWAEITARGRVTGRNIACGDVWIAAAAVRHDIPLLSHNAQHFIDLPGIKLITHREDIK